MRLGGGDKKKVNCNRLEYDDTIRRSIVRSDCLLKGETSDMDRQIHILGFCPRGKS